MNIKLFYTDNGPENNLAPLILLHGNGGNSSSFFYVVDYFSKFRRVITVDTRGHGRTPMGDAPFTLAQFAEDLYKFMLEKEIPSAVLVGYSDGGNIAMLFAKEHLDMVSAMVLNGANMFPEGLEKKDLRSIKKAYKKACRKLRRHPEDEKVKKEVALLRLMTDEPSLTPDQLSKMNVPALVLVGSRDAIKPEHTELIVSSLPNAELAVVDGGHNIVKTNSEPYIEKIENFLTKHGK